MPEVELLATIRPDGWNLALFLHILGAMAALGAFVMALVYLAAAARGSAPSLRAAFRVLLFAGIPGYIVMRGGAEWIYLKEFPEGSTDPDWIGIGYAVVDLGLLLLLIATISTGVASRCLASGGDASKTGAAKVSAVLCGILIVAYVIAIWAMTTKPG